MRVSDTWMHIADLVNQAEAVIESRERQVPDVWAMTAFSRYRLVQLLELAPITSYDVDPDVDPVALLEQATASAEQAGSNEDLAEALRCALADIRMACGACDV